MRNKPFPPFYNNNSVMLFGHRGNSIKAPDNTLAAFKKLLDDHIPGVELDVMLCGSGEIVVSHDYNLKKSSGVDLSIEKEDYNRIKELDVGSWFSPEFKDERIPLLKDVFELLGNKVYYNIETKSEKIRTGLLEAKLFNTIKNFGLEKNCIISSFNPFSIKAVKKIAPALPTSLIYSRSKRLPFILRYGAGRLFTGFSFIQPYYKLINPVSVHLNKNIFRNPVIAWTVNDVSESNRLIDLGISGIISNNPSVLLAGIKKPPAEPAGSC
ncbi:MAG: glycerophosphodiester phosphodiesterase [Spirochaetes bacterium]|nr:glycerophosphodiester phosphodiesterase [Spirochaetota bacterium]